MTAKRFFLPGVISALMVLSCHTPPLPQATATVATFSAQPDWAKFGLAANDILRVTVFNHAEYSTPPGGTRVDLEGNLSLPLLGPIPVVGQGVEQTRQAITERLSTYLKNPSVSVSVVAYGSRQVFVFGHVASPGAYLLDRPLTALQALSLGGGFRSGADHENIVLMRGEAESLEVHVFDASTPGPDGFIIVQPNDFVFIRHVNGTFTEQVLPVLTAFTSSASALASLVIAEQVLRNRD